VLPTWLEAEDHRIGPLDIRARCRWKTVGRFIIGFPRRVLSKRRWVTGFRDVPHPHVRTGRFARFGQTLRHRGAVAGGGIVNDREVGQR
jgi:hypothetical protein